MSKISEEIKHNKYTMIAVVIFIIILAIGFVFYKAFFPNNGSPVYGNRLAGISDVAITTEQQEKMVEKIKEQKIVEDINYNLNGRIFNVIISVSEGTSIENAKKLTDIVVADMTEEQLDYFDYQVFIKTENVEKEGYYIIGYLNKESEVFSYSVSKQE